MRSRFDWSNPVGEVLYFLTQPLLRWRGVHQGQKDLRDHRPQPVILEPVEVACKPCRKTTEHDEFEWVVEQETTRECRTCGEVTVLA